LTELPDTATNFTPRKGMPLNSWPNLIRLAEIASLFRLDKEFLCSPALINSPKAVDEFIRGFFEEVNENHFPVNTNYWSDKRTLQHPALQDWIPVRPRGFDNWHYNDPITLFMTLADLEDDPEPALDCLACDYPQFDVPWGFRLSDLAMVLDRTPLTGPLAALPSFIRMITKRTGTFSPKGMRSAIFRSLPSRI